MNVTICSVLPKEVEERLAAFLAAGKSGGFELSILNGSVAAWKIIESGRPPRRRG